jgi:hypothetical protein
LLAVDCRLIKGMTEEKGSACARVRKVLSTILPRPFTRVSDGRLQEMAWSIASTLGFRPVQSFCANTPW